MTALLTQSHLLEAPIGEGDCGIVFKPDGSFHVFSTGAVGTNTDPVLLDNMRKIMAFALALQVPPLMQILLDVLEDEAIVGTVLDIGKPN